MDHQVHTQQNAPDDITVSIEILYAEEEYKALTATQSWEKPCLDQVKARLGFFRDTALIMQPTFRHFVRPGLLIDKPFTSSYARIFSEKFWNKYGGKVQKQLAPILAEYRRMVHQEAAGTRDDYFGAGTQARRIS